MRNLQQATALNNSENNEEKSDDSTEYQKLNDKCDIVISKIKNRKNKSKK